MYCNTSTRDACPKVLLMAKMILSIFFKLKFQNSVFN